MGCVLFGAGIDRYTPTLLINTTAIAPMGVKILLRRGSAQKIETNSGIKLLKTSKRFLKRNPIYKVRTYR